MATLTDLLKKIKDYLSTPVNPQTWQVKEPIIQNPQIQQTVSQFTGGFARGLSPLPIGQAPTTTAGQIGEVAGEIAGFLPFLGATRILKIPKYVGMAGEALKLSPTVARVAAEAVPFAAATLGKTLTEEATGKQPVKPLPEVFRESLASGAFAAPFGLTRPVEGVLPKLAQTVGAGIVGSGASQLVQKGQISPQEALTGGLALAPFALLGVREKAVPQVGETLTAKILKTGEELTGTVKKIARMPTGAVMAQLETAAGETKWIPVSKYAEWYKPVEKAAKQALEQISVPPVNEKVNQAEELLGRKLSQQVEKATKPAGQITELPKEQPVMGGGQQIPPSQPIIPPEGDPVQKVIQALKEAKPLRGKQEKIYSQIRSKQAGAIAGIGQEMKGEETYFKQLGQLKGELPKVQFESIRSKLKQEDIIALFNKIEQSSLAPFEKIHAKSGLSKLLGAEGGAVPQQSELALLNEIFPPEFIQQVLDKRPFLQKLFSLGEEGLNIPRAVMATADLSAPLRQGVFLVGRPKQWIPAFGNMFRYAFSENAYKGLLEDIRSRPTYQAMREAKLALTDISPILQGREEAFMSNLIERIPIFGRIARGSNRAYSGFLNKLRADVFDDLYKNAKNLGVLEERPQVAEDIAKFVNSATGRGDLGALNRAAVVLNGVFFSPRLMASRINLLNPYYYMKLDPFVRKEALKSLFTFAGTALATLTLAKLGGAEVGTDPRSADFGKIKIGNTRYDILGGFQQYIKLAAQEITGKLISSTTGKEYTLGEGYKPLTRRGILGRFFESKEAPFASFVAGLLQGQNTLGQPFNIPTEVVNRFIPMIISDMYDIAKDKNSPLAAIMATPGIFGVGVQTYGKQVPNLEFTPTGKPKIKLSPIGGLAEDIVRKFTGQPESNLPAELQQPLVQKIQSEQQKKVEIDKIKQQAEKGDLTQKGNYIPIITNEGVKVIDLSFQPKPPVLTGNTELDKKAISKFNGEITKKANDIYDLYQAGKMSAQEAEQELLKLKELKAKTGKTEAGGRKIKISKPPTLKIKQGKPAKIKTSLKVKVARPRRVAALKIAKPKAQTGIRIPKQTYQPIPIRFGRA